VRVLTPELSSKIAAGEVVERPASVVKELVENALDAGATEIDVESRGGGIELLKVSDNGAGIAAAEVELAFQRYATSKISTLKDLEAISSLGFRGEALPSIAAVAEVEVSTLAEGETVGSSVYVREGQQVRRESRARPRGTTVTVRRLFRQFPVRFKFLRSASTENSHIASVLTQYALAFPEVRFSLSIDGRASLRTPGAGALREVLGEIYGGEVAEQALNVEGANNPIKVSGLTSPPHLSRSNRNCISTLVNRRWVRSPMLNQAIAKAYQGLLMDGRHPVSVINLSIPAREVDVNVHPTKAQVKFSDEAAVFGELERAVESALERTPIARPRPLPFPSTPWEYGSPSMVREAEPQPAAPALPSAGLPFLRPLGQIAGTYIVAEGPDGLDLIDQHAAHERILYDRIMEQLSQGNVEVQGLLQPVTLELSPRDVELLKAHAASLAQFGFSVDHFGDRSYLIRAVPALLAGRDVAAATQALLTSLAGRESPEGWESTIAESLACHGAVRGGQQLGDQEMRELLNSLEQTRQPRTCPHGRPTTVHLSLRQLEKEFGRTG